MPHEAISQVTSSPAGPAALRRPGVLTARRRVDRLGALGMLALALAALPLAACDGTPALEEVRAQIESALPGLDLVPEENIHLGRFTLGLARWVVGRDGGSRASEPVATGDEDVAGGGRRSEEDDAVRVLRAIHRIDVATYRVRAMPANGADGWSPEVARRLTAAGWSVIVHAAERGEETWVFYRTGAGGAVMGIYVISLERDKLSLVRLAGSFDQEMARVVALRPGSVVPVRPEKPARVTQAAPVAPAAPAAPAAPEEPGAPVG